MKAKKVLAMVALAIAAVATIVLVFFASKNRNGSYSVVATNFISYDFARAIMGNGDNIKMLIKPATETHSFEPTPQDIIDITNADFVIYVGGESDEWVDRVLRDNNIDDGKTIRLMDFVDLKKEELKDGMNGESEDVYDEHIWTSPLNAIRIIEAVRDRFVAKEPSKLNTYTDNAQKYIARFQSIDQETRTIIDNAKHKELIFADRFPFRYFVDEYGLDYYAAFPGCSDQTEASSNTIAFLIDKVKTDNIPVVLKIELTSDALAKTISNETNVKVLTLNAGHNISRDDFNNGKTYADIMTENLAVLREALQ